MSLKSKGIQAERELIHLLWSAGLAAARVAGSGSSRYPSCDIIAGGSGQLFAFECKSVKQGNRYLDKQSVADFLRFAQMLGAQPWIAVRYAKEQWHFIMPEDLVETHAAHGVSLAVAQRRGLLLDELVGNIRNTIK